jgi:hypothetical protein
MGKEMIQREYKPFTRRLLTCIAKVSCAFIALDQNSGTPFSAKKEKENPSDSMSSFNSAKTLRN